MGNAFSNASQETKQNSLNILGQELHGITDYYIIKDTQSSTDPSVIMLLGEVHGKQTCGESDYVSAYERFLDYNQSNQNVPIDIFIESTNTDGLHVHEYKQWMGKLTQTFQDCFLYYQKNPKKCKYTNARFHWTDPHQLNESWLDQGISFPFTAPDNWRDEYPDISEHIKTKDDLIKIILQNSFIRKNGERCKIPNWEQLVKLQFDDVYEHEFKPVWRTFGWQNDNEWWKYGIFYTFRFVQDVYAFLRMFRHPKNQLEKYEEANRFKNIIYHAGANHIKWIKRMLLRYKESYKVVKESHATEGKHCIRINFMDFLNGIDKNGEGYQHVHDDKYVGYDDDTKPYLIRDMYKIGGRSNKNIHIRSKKKIKYRNLKRSLCRRR